MKTLAQAIAEHDHRARYGTAYGQTADDFARGPEIARKRTGDSLKFRKNADRYELNLETGQYELNM